MRHSLSRTQRELPLQNGAARQSDLPQALTYTRRCVLLVGQDHDFHSAMSFALAHTEVQHRSLHFMHAHSAAQAKKLSESINELAVVLLDQLSLSEEESMDVLATLRADKRFADVRIVVRTAVENHPDASHAFAAFDITAYLIGVEIDRTACVGIFRNALRSYQQLADIRTGNRGLEKILDANRKLIQLTAIEEFSSAVLHYLSDLLNLPDDGLICIRETLHTQESELFVVAATGMYEPLLNHQASTFEAPMQEAIKKALHEQRNIHAGEFTALYFSGEASRCLIAVIKHPRSLSEVETRLLDVFCSTISIGLTNILLVTRLHNSAFYDSLTKLPNRARLKEIIDETMSERKTISHTLALIDIDHFAETNDTLGHQFGDHLLLAVTTRLQSRLGHHLIVARISGDTFGVLGDDLQVTPEAIFSQFEKPFQIGAQNVQLSATVGLLRLNEHEGSGAEALKNAHIALKRAKLQQRAGHLYFSRNMGIDIRERVNMMHALRHAFEEKRLYVVYQPQIDMNTRTAIGAEALLRWCGDDGTMISPNRFIPIAEYSGLIIELGEWVLRQACLETVRLSRSGFDHFMISINVSQVQFRHPQFLHMLQRILAETKAAPHCIELEITESMAMEDPEALITLLSQITATGVSIAIDDFGTGFSSLSHLQKLNVDRLKIDRAFVTEITESARGSSIAEAIIQLGRNLGLDVVAEGVENERQALVLSELGCACGQGYLYAQPMTSDKLDAWLHVHSNSIDQV